MQNWNVCDGKCATGIFKTFGGKFPTPLFQTDKVRNFFSLMWKKSDETLLIYEVWKMCDDYLLHCGRFATMDFCMLENVRRSQIVQYCDGKCATAIKQNPEKRPNIWKMCDGHKKSNSVMENVRRLLHKIHNSVCICWKMCDGHK